MARPEQFKPLSPCETQGKKVTLSFSFPLLLSRCNTSFIHSRINESTKKTVISELVEAALRLALEKLPEPKKMTTLPNFDSGGALVDIADREALYQAMEGR